MVPDAAAGAEADVASMGPNDVCVGVTGTVSAAAGTAAGWPALGARNVRGDVRSNTGHTGVFWS